VVDDLNSLKIIGYAELQERPIEEVKTKLIEFDFRLFVEDLS